MRRVLAAALAAFLALACIAAPCDAVASRHEPARRFVLRVGVPTSWSSAYRQRIATVVRRLRSYGVRVEYGRPGAPGVVSILPHSFGGGVIGYYDLEAHRVLVDVTAVDSVAEFDALLLHELGHAIGMRHVCRSARELALRGGDCSPVAWSTAVMNPYLHYAGDPDVTVEFTAADRAELRRAMDAWRNRVDPWSDSYPASGPQESPQ